MTKLTFTSCILAILVFLSSLHGEQMSHAKLYEKTEEEAKESLRLRREAYNEYRVYLSEIERSFDGEMRRDYNLCCSGSSGRMHKRIKELGLDFHANRRATIEEARALHLLVLEKYIQAINSDDRLKPFLRTYPFTQEQVKISLTFKGLNGSNADGSIYHTLNVHVPDEQSPAVHCSLYYSIRDPLSRDEVDILKESYEEAVRKNALAAVENPAIHPVTPKEEAIDQLFLTFRERMKKRHRLECWSIGGDMVGDINSVGAKFVALHEATQEEARSLLVDISNSLLESINSSKELKAYFVEETFPVERLRLSLCFKKKHSYFSYDNGSMESVVLEGGHLTYYQEPPLHGEVLPVTPLEIPVYATESYEEALAALEKGA